MEPAAEGPPLAKTASTSSAERAHRVFTWPARETGYVDLDGVNFSHIDAHFEVAIDALHHTSQMGGDRGEWQAGHMHRADFGNVDLAFTADTQIGAEIDLTPNADSQLVVDTNDHFSRCRPMIERAK